MRNTNRLLIRLNKAVEASNSKYISEKALAIILFDNLIETHLYHLLTNKIFIYKGEQSRGIYKYNDYQIKYFEDILKFAKKENLITNEEQKLLNFTHKQRNKIYHESKIVKNDIELALILYYIFLVTKKEEWEQAASFRVFSSDVDDEQIDFGQGIIEETFLFDHKKYFFKAWDYIIQKWEIKNDLAIACKTNILEQLECIEKSIDYLSKTIEEHNYLYSTKYYSFVKEAEAENCRNIDFILLVHMYYRLEYENRNKKNEFEDIKSFINRYHKKYPNWINIDKIRKRLIDFDRLSEDKIFENYIEIETRIFDLYNDSYDAMCYLDGYIQYLYDQYRGK